MKLDSNYTDNFDRNENDNDHHKQSGVLLRKVMTDQEKQNTVNNFVGPLKEITGPKKEETNTCQSYHFYKADRELALR